MDGEKGRTTIAISYETFPQRGENRLTSLFSLSLLPRKLHSHAQDVLLRTLFSRPHNTS